MAQVAYEIVINEATSDADLQRCLIECVAHPFDLNFVRVGAEARVELARRERQERMDQFNADSRERVKAQQFQEAQITRQIEAQEKVAAKQLEIADQQAKTAKHAMYAAWGAVGAALISAVVTIAAG